MKVNKLRGPLEDSIISPIFETFFYSKKKKKKKRKRKVPTQPNQKKKERRFFLASLNFELKE